MANADIEMMTDDERPLLDSTLSDTNGPVDLTGAAVHLIVHDDDGNLELFDSTTDGATKITVVGATSGAVRYSWAEGDLSTAGHYKVQWRATLADGDEIRFPNNDYLSMLVRQGLSTG